GTVVQVRRRRPIGLAGAVRLIAPEREAGDRQAAGRGERIQRSRTVGLASFAAHRRVERAAARAAVPREDERFGGRVGDVIDGCGAARAGAVGDPAEEVVVAVRRGRRGGREEAEDAEEDHGGRGALAAPVPGGAHAVYLLPREREILLMLTRRRRPRFSPQPISVV